MCGKLEEFSEGTKFACTLGRAHQYDIAQKINCFSLLVFYILIPLELNRLA